MSNRPVDKREKRLRDLASVLCKHNRSDLTLAMGQLSLEFYRQATLAEGYVHGDDLERAEGHRLIAEAIHDTLTTLEVKKREFVEAASVITETAMNDVKEGDSDVIKTQM
jgi:hypothetical protein